MKTITLPMFDETGELSVIVIEALANGATSANNPYDSNTFFLTFPKAADARAVLLMLDTMAANGDPVDDQPTE